MVGSQVLKRPTRECLISGRSPWDGNPSSSLPLSPTEIESHIIKQEDILNGKENEIKELQQVISQQKEIFR